MKIRVIFLKLIQGVYEAARTLIHIPFKNAGKEKSNPTKMTESSG